MKVRPSTVKTATGGAVAGLDQRELRAGRIGGKVGRPEHVVGAVEDLEDLVLAIDVVAHRHDVDAGLDQLFVAFDGQARAAGGVLGVADDQAQPPARDEPGQDLADDLAARGADDVADEEDLQRHGQAHLSRARSTESDVRTQRANSTLRVSRRTVTLTSPG